MAGDEDEAEEVVADGVVETGVEVGRGLFEGFEFAGEHSVFAFGDGVAAEEIDGAAFVGDGKPCGAIIGDARLRPLFECGDKCLLREVFQRGRRSSDRTDAKSSISKVTGHEATRISRDGQPIFGIKKEVISIFQRGY
jgi:hypothetical protein